MQNELQEALDENDLRGFRALLDDAKHTGHNLDASYGAESSHKTILHLALEEDDGYPYVEELLIVSFAHVAVYEMISNVRNICRSCNATSN